MMIYTFKFNWTWYGAPGLLLTLMGPFIPFGIMLFELFRKVKDKFSGPNWMEEGPGRVFFVKPPNPLGDFLWACYLNQSTFVGQFLLSGTHADAITHTWEDTILTKDFWRKALEAAGARVPR